MLDGKKNNRSLCWQLILLLCKFSAERIFFCIAVQPRVTWMQPKDYVPHIGRQKEFVCLVLQPSIKLFLSNIFKIFLERVEFLNENMNCLVHV